MPPRPFARTTRLTVLVVAMLTGCASVQGTASPAAPGLTSASSSSPSPSNSTTAAEPDVKSARAGLARWIADNKPATPQTSTDIRGCPAIALDDVQSALAAAGATAPVKDWGTEVEWNEYSEIDPDLLGIACGGDSDGDSHDSDTGVAFGIAAVDLTGKGTFTQLQSTVGVDGVTDQPAPSLPGGTVQVACPDGTCIAFWHDGDGLVLAVSIIGVERLDASTAATIIDTIGPKALQTLAGLRPGQ